MQKRLAKWTTNECDWNGKKIYDGRNNISVCKWSEKRALGREINFTLVFLCARSWDIAENELCARANVCVHGFQVCFHRATGDTIRCNVFGCIRDECCRIANVLRFSFANSLILTSSGALSTHTHTILIVRFQARKTTQFNGWTRYSCHCDHYLL